MVPEIGTREKKQFKLLDLYCGAGGAAVGLYRAGFEITGVDIVPQPHYPFRFILGDALQVNLEGYDCYWASPPCQFATMAGRQWRTQGRKYPDLIGPTRERLKATGKPYIIENVPGAPLINPIVLNGALFSLRLRRTRLFETNFPVPFILLPREGRSGFRMGRPPAEVITPVGHFSGVKRAQKEMGIDWMGQKDLAQAIPPVYAEFLGRALLRAMGIEP